MRNLYIFFQIIRIFLMIISELALLFVPTKEHIRKVLFCKFHKSADASAVTKLILLAYGIEPLSERGGFPDSKLGIFSTERGKGGSSKST